MHGRRGRIIAAGTICAALLAAPPPAAARITVSVQFTFGAAVAGGAGFIVLVAGEWRLPVAAGDLPTALVEIRDGRARLGVPLPSLILDTSPPPGRGRTDGIQLDLLHWRF